MLLPVLAINCWNAYACLLIGTSLNVLLSLLARKYSSTELRDYRCLLLYFSVLNSLALALQALTQPLFLIGNDGISYIFLGGIASRSTSIPLRVALFALYSYCSALAIVSLALQFLDRYLLICRAVSRKACRIAVFISASLFLALLCANCMLSTVPSKEQQIDLLLANFLVPSKSENISTAKIAMEIDVNNALARNAFVAFVCLLLLCYVAIVFCYARIRAFIQKNMIEKGAGSSKRDLVRQISLNMLLQASLPLYCITIYAFSISLMLSRHFSSDLLQFELLSFVPLNWLPVLNPLVTILSIRKYREGLMAFLVRKNAPNEL